MLHLGIHECCMSPLNHELRFLSSRELLDSMFKVGERDLLDKEQRLQWHVHHVKITAPCLLCVMIMSGSRHIRVVLQQRACVCLCEWVCYLRSLVFKRKCCMSGVESGYITSAYRSSTVTLITRGNLWSNCLLASWRQKKYQTQLVSFHVCWFDAFICHVKNTTRFLSFKIKNIQSIMKLLNRSIHYFIHCTDGCSLQHYVRLENYQIECLTLLWCIRTFRPISLHLL